MTGLLFHLIGPLVAFGLFLFLYNTKIIRFAFNLTPNTESINGLPDWAAPPHLSPGGRCRTAVRPTSEGGAFRAVHTHLLHKFPAGAIFGLLGQGPVAAPAATFVLALSFS